MNYLNNIYYIYANMDSNSKFLLTMIIIIIVLLVIILVASLIINNKEKRRQEEIKSSIPKKRNINKNVIYDEDLLKENKITAVKANEEKDKVADITLTPVKKEEPEMIEDTDDFIEEEIIEVIDEETDENLENIKKMIEDTIEQGPIRLNDYELEQEQNAIISYDELVKRAGAKKIIYKKKNDVKEEKREEVKVQNNTYNSFRPSQIVSPIFGVQRENVKKDEVQKSFDDIENMKFRLSSTSKEEMQNDVEFLNNLKQFRNSLD